MYSIKKTPVVVIMGDIIAFYGSLWVMLLIRYLEFPTRELYYGHAIPFTFLVFMWLLVFYVGGLYEKQNSILRRTLPLVIIKIQIINSVLAVIFFYFIPYFSITPKTNLFIYLLTSLVFLMLWRLVFADIIQKQKKQGTLLIGRGSEMKELREAINEGEYGYHISHSINLDHQEVVDIQQDVINQIYENGISSVIIDTRDDGVLPLLPCFYNLMFSEIAFIDMHEVYEQIFGRIPLSLVKHGWFLENVRTKPRIVYDAIKRITDMVLAFFLGIISLPLYLFIIAALAIEGGKGIFSIQERVGWRNKKVKLYKFRTMTYSNDGGKWEGETGKKNEVTKVGKVLRKTRLDELPQLWNVFRGHVSLIGPRPEFADPVKEYSDAIPYYNIRHLIKPGLSGWAQIYGEHPHHGIDVEATQNKLAHDLYYVKNRSLFLDMKIVLKTLRVLVLSKGK